jgi:predicted XRE-type DNA-binding protein
MNDLIDRLRNDFQDEDYRHSYAEECLNTMVATQIKVLREQREMSQVELAEKTGMKQPRIPLLEDANYSSWTLSTLKRFARAFDVALTVRFDSFSDVVLDFESMSRETLQRPAFQDDPLLNSKNVRPFRRARRVHNPQDAVKRALQAGQLDFWTGNVLEMPTPKPEPSPMSQEGQRPVETMNPGAISAQQGKAYAASVGYQG